MIQQYTPEALAAYDWSRPIAFRGMPFSIYAAVTALNGSLAKEALKSSHKAAYYLSNAKNKPRTQGLLFGTAWHAAMLEPETFDDIAVSVTEGKTTYSTRSTGIGAKAWVAANPGLVPFDDEDRETVAGMVARAAAGGWTFKDSSWMAEVVILWERDSVRRKARLDGLDLKRAKPMVLEIKSAESVDPADFSRSIATYGYHVSAVHYIEAVTQLTRIVPDYSFFAQEKCAPFDFDCWPPDQNMLDEGARELEAAAEMWRRTNAFANPELGVMIKAQTIGLPKWHKPREIAFYGSV